MVVVELLVKNPFEGDDFFDALIVLWLLKLVLKKPNSSAKIGQMENIMCGGSVTFS